MLPYQYMVLVWSLLTSMTLAFLIPEGQGDGVYQGYFDENGHQVSRKIDDLLPNDLLPDSKARSSETSHMLSKRNDYFCYRVILNRNDVGTAAFNLGQTCDKPRVDVPPRNFLYAISGDAVAYVCNPYTEGKKCHSELINKAITLVEKLCPVVRAGFVQYTEGGPKTIIGYQVVTNEICVNYHNGFPHGPVPSGNRKGKKKEIGGRTIEREALDRI